MEYLYWIEEKNNIFYVYYWKSNQGIVITLFHTAHTYEEAEQAIKDHKEKKHPTQWEPRK